MNKQEKLSFNAKSSETKRRSERVLKRKENDKEKISKTVPKTVRKQISKQEPVQPLIESKTKEKAEVDVVPAAIGKFRRKRKCVGYEIDCSGVNMDIRDFQKDMWNRAKNGKFNLAKNVRIKRNGSTIVITSRSYVSKKCVRSNVHFLTTIYLKQKKLDRSVHVVGNGNQYKLMYK